jgi:ferritin heavy chain
MSHVSQKQTSLVRQNYSETTESAVNQIINYLIFSAYQSASMACYFERDQVGLYGFSQLFSHVAKKKMSKAKFLMSYQVKRGGQVKLDGIHKPQKQEWKNAIEALEDTLESKRIIFDIYNQAHNVAMQLHDVNFAHTIKHELLSDLVPGIQRFAFYISKMQRVGITGLGEYIFDMDLIQENNFKLDKYSVTKTEFVTGPLYYK